MNRKNYVLKSVIIFTFAMALVTLIYMLISVFSNKNSQMVIDTETMKLVQLEEQFTRLASIPNYPGSYIIDRYTNFAFLAAFDDLANPTEELLSYVTTINKEITRKRAEFDLPTLELGQTLADKLAEEAAKAEGGSAESDLISTKIHKTI